MKYTLFILFLLISQNAIASDENELRQIRSEIQQIESEQRSESSQFGPSWYVNRHRACSEISERNYQEIITCRENLKRSHNTLISNRENRERKLRELRGKEQLLASIMRLNNQIPASLPATDAEKRRVMQALAERARLYVDRSEWNNRTNQQKQDDRMKAADDYGRAAEIAAELGDISAMTRYLDLQTDLM